MKKLLILRIESIEKLKALNCPTKYNSSAIDEMLLIFLVAAKASGVSYFKDIGELNQKESPRLKWGAKTHHHHVIIIALLEILIHIAINII